MYKQTEYAGTMRQKHNLQVLATYVQCSKFKLSTNLYKVPTRKQIITEKRFSAKKVHQQISLRARLVVQHVLTHLKNSPPIRTRVK